MGVLGFTVLVSTASAIPKARLNCTTALHAIPAPVYLHSETISTLQSDRLSQFHEVLQSLLGDNRREYETDQAPLSDFPEFFRGGHVITWYGLRALDEALPLLRALIFFQSDFVSRYEHWVGGLSFQSREPSALERMFPALLKNRDVKKVGGKNTFSWLSYGARQAFLEIEQDTLKKHPVDEVADERMPLIDDRIPVAFGSWMRQHATIAAHYDVAPSRLLGELARLLDGVYHQPAVFH